MSQSTETYQEQHAIGAPERKPRKPRGPYRVKRTPDLYFIQRGAGGPIKIGISRDVQKRLNELSLNCGEPLRLLASFEGLSRLETPLHKMFADQRLQGEWFKPSIRLLAEIAKLLQGEAEQWRESFMRSGGLDRMPSRWARPEEWAKRVTESWREEAGSLVRPEEV